MDDAEYRWTVRHKHLDGACGEELALRLDGVLTRILFREGDGRIASGSAPYWHTGLVAEADGESLNLHEPRVVRAFVDEAVQRGLLPGAGTLDGWELYPAVVLRCAAAATPGVPPGCLPGP